MKRAIILLLVVLSAAPALDSRLVQADTFYEADQTGKALNLCIEVLEDESGNAQALWRMARIHCTIGDAEKSKSDKLTSYQKALTYAERAKDKGPSLAEAWFWYGVSMGRVGLTRGITASISMAGPIKNAFLKTVGIDANHTGALFGLGMWYKEVPGIAGGDLDKSINYFKRVIRIDPDYTESYVRLAEIYIKRNEYATARNYLNRCLSISSPTYPDDYYSFDKPKAEELLAEIEGK